MAPFDTITAALHHHAEQSPDQTAYRFLTERGSKSVAISYRELYLSAANVAVHLQKTCQQGDRVLLMYPPSLDYIVAFLGCLLANVIAVPLYPPRANQKLMRANGVMENCGATLILSNDTVSQVIVNLVDKGIMAEDFKVISTESLEQRSNEFNYQALSPHALAFLQYTSGSTGEPKGVMVSHGNLAANQLSIGQGFESKPEDIYLHWLPMFHDMGLIGSVLHPLYTGSLGILMPPADFIADPLCWLEAIDRYQATVAGAPNFAFDLMLQRFDTERVSNIRLDSLKLMFSGAEPIRAETLNNFSREFSQTGFKPTMFFPCYGMAEATLYITAGPSIGKLHSHVFDLEQLGQGQEVLDCGYGPSIELVGCGICTDDDHIKIVDPHTHQALAEGKVGEIWFDGPSKTQGYWQQHQLTEQQFNAKLDNGEGSYLRTGDLGFILEQQLYVTGRLKDLIIVHGRNYYPQDIELTAGNANSAFNSINCAAFSVEHSDDEAEGVVVVLEVNRSALRKLDKAKAISDVVAQVAAQHELQLDDVVLLRPMTIAKTTSGKIQRHRNKQLYLASELSVVASLRQDLPQSHEAQAQHKDPLLALISQFVTVPKDVDDMTPLLNLGMDSLKAASLAYQLEQEFGLVIDFIRLIDELDIGSLRRMIEQLSTEKPQVQVIGREVEWSGELSEFQNMLWYAYLADPQSAAQNVSLAFECSPSFSPSLFSQALSELVDGNWLLRAGFEQQAFKPQMKVLDNPLICEQVKLGDEKTTQQLLAEHHDLPFNLYEQGPLRALLIENSAQNQWTVMVTVHHIVCDYDSMTNMLKRLHLIYQALQHGKSIPLPEALRQDFVYWHQRQLTEDYCAHAKNFWCNYLQDFNPRLKLPEEHARPRVRTFNGDAVNFTMTEQLSKQLRALALECNVTGVVVSLAIYAVSLMRLSRQSELTIGIPVNCAAGTPFEHNIGCHINTLPIRIKLSDGVTFRQLLRQIATDIRHIITHRFYSAQRVIEAVNAPNEPEIAPLFQTLFAYYVDRDDLVSMGPAFLSSGASLPMGDHGASSIEVPVTTSQFDWCFSLAEAESGYTAQLSFNCDIYAKSTVEQWQQSYINLCQELVEDPNKAVYSFEDATRLKADDRDYLLHSLNDTHSSFPQERLIHQWFEIQADKTPDAVAAIFGQERLTYAQLNQKANQLARFLRQHGVGEEQLIGVAKKRSLDMLVSVFAILKAGGAYVALDPNYPDDRLEHMINDSGLKVILTQEDLLPQFNYPHLDVIAIEQVASQCAALDESELDNLGQQTSSLAYILYTSGSTGLPKGVMLEHRSVSAFIHWAISYFNTEQLQSMLCSTSLNFDLSVFEMFTPLAIGGRCVIVDSLLSLADKQNPVADISMINTVASVLNGLLTQDTLPNGIKAIGLGGEAPKLPLVDKLLTEYPQARLFNLYGPTEDTIYSLAMEIPQGIQQDPLIGRPILNTQIYILDSDQQLCPLGTIGELYLGGMGLARGYHNNPEQTADKFVPHPFSDDPNARLYQTGDLVRLLPDGNVEFIGRTDQQVKIRGFRIELKEIEFQINAMESIENSVVIAEENFVSQRKLENDRELVDEVSSVHSSPLDKTRSETKSHSCEIMRSRLSVDTSLKLQALTKKYQLTPFMLLHGALSILLSRHVSNQYLFIDIPDYSRMQGELITLINSSANSTLLSADTSYSSLKSYFEHIRQMYFDAHSNQCVRLKQLIEILKQPSSNEHTQLLKVMVTGKTIGVAKENDSPESGMANIGLSPYQSDAFQVKFDLHVDMTVDDNGIDLSWTYDASIFDKSYIKQFDDHLNRLLMGFSGFSNENIAPYKLPMLSKKEEYHLVTELNDTAMDFPKDKCIHELFEQQAKENPDNIAVVFENEQYTYRELNEKSNQLAYYLVETQGITPDTLVGLCVERSLEMVVGILGILKAGGAYVPLDTNYPQQRLADMIEDASLTTIVSHKQAAQALDVFTGQVINLDDTSLVENYPKINLKKDTLGLTSNHLAYVIYTSGSTGQPKGVMVEHRSVVNYQVHLKTVYDFNSADNILQFSTISFDIFVEEFFGALCHGSQLILRNESCLSSKQAFINFCESYQVSVISVPTAFWAQIVSSPGFVETSSLRIVIVGGELLSQSVITNHNHTFTADVMLFNSYGPTEATVTATTYAIPNINRMPKVVPIGKANINNQLFIMDSNKELTPFGCTGELYIGGEGVARGYLNRPELTEERFIDNPYYDECNQNSSAYLYRTGDIVRYLADGNLEFIGREDDQVKIRGFRIELGEIVNQLSEINNIDSALVMEKVLKRGKQLVAYVKVKEAVEKGLVDDIARHNFLEKIKSHLSKKLPDYMLPSLFLLVKEWPLTPNGKIDKKALSQLNVEIDIEECRYQNETEQKLAEIVGILLGIAMVPRKRDLLSLGMDSLQASKFLGEIRTKFNVLLSYKDLFESPNLAALATKIEELNDHDDVGEDTVEMML